MQGNTCWRCWLTQRLTVYTLQWLIIFTGANLENWGRICIMDIQFRMLVLFWIARWSRDVMLSGCCILHCRNPQHPHDYIIFDSNANICTVKPKIYARTCISDWLYKKINNWDCSAIWTFVMQLVLMERVLPVVWMVIWQLLYHHIVVGCHMVVCFVIMLHQWYGHVSCQWLPSWLLSSRVASSCLMVVVAWSLSFVTVCMATWPLWPLFIHCWCLLGRWVGV